MGGDPVNNNVSIFLVFFLSAVVYVYRPRSDIVGRTTISNSFISILLIGTDTGCAGCRRVERMV